MVPKHVQASGSRRWVGVASKPPRPRISSLLPAPREAGESTGTGEEIDPQPFADTSS